MKWLIASTRYENCSTHFFNKTKRVWDWVELKQNNIFVIYEIRPWQSSRKSVFHLMRINLTFHAHNLIHSGILIKIQRKPLLRGSNQFLNSVVRLAKRSQSPSKAHFYVPVRLENPFSENRIVSQRLSARVVSPLLVVY